jgi:hypothetical protein
MSEFITAIVITIIVCSHAMICSLTEISACTWRQNTPTQQGYISITLPGITSQKVVTLKTLSNKITSFKPHSNNKQHTC